MKRELVVLPEELIEETQQIDISNMNNSIVHLTASVEPVKGAINKTAAGYNRTVAAPLKLSNVVREKNAASNVALTKGHPRAVGTIWTLVLVERGDPRTLVFDEVVEKYAELTE